MRRREEWERMRTEGQRRFLIRHGVLARGLPMALITMVLIEGMQGNLALELLASPGFHRRFLFALAVFSIGGIVSAYARWKALEKRFEQEER